MCVAVKFLSALILNVSFFLCLGFSVLLSSSYRQGLPLIIYLTIFQKAIINQVAGGSWKSLALLALSFAENTMQRRRGAASPAVKSVETTK